MIKEYSTTGIHMAMMMISVILFAVAMGVIVMGSFICAMIALVKMGKKEQTRIVLRMLMLTFFSSAATTVMLAMTSMMAVSAGDAHYCYYIRNIVAAFE